jgi:YVTN family beta-propeller protein
VVTTQRTETPSLSYEELTSTDVGGGPHAHIAYVGAQEQVWVLNGTSHSLSVLDGTTGELTATIALPGAPRHIIIDEAADAAYITLAEDAVAVVRLTDGSTTANLALPPGSTPYVTVPHPLLNRLFVLNDGNGTFSTIDTQQLAVLKTVEVGKKPGWGQPHKKSVGKIHVTNRGSDTVSVIDETTGEVTATVPTGKEPTRNGVYRERNAMYTANLGDKTLTGISTIDDSVIGTAHLPIDPWRLVPADKKTGRSEIWVLGRGGNGSAGGIVTVDSETHETSSRVDTVDNPANWLFEGSIGQVVSTNSREMAVFDCRSRMVIGDARLSHDPDPTSHSNMVKTNDGRLFLVNADDTVTVFTPLES